MRKVLVVGLMLVIVLVGFKALAWSPKPGTQLLKSDFVSQESSRSAALVLHGIRMAEHFGPPIRDFNDWSEPDRQTFREFFNREGISGNWTECVAELKRRSALADFQVSSQSETQNSKLKTQNFEGAVDSPFLPLSFYLALPEIPVTNSADSGTGTLREAVAMAENAGGNQRIVFHLPTTDPNFDATKGVWNIKLNTRIIFTKSRIMIDGMSQTNFGGDTNLKGPEVVIDGRAIRGASDTIDGAPLLTASVFFIYKGDQNWIRGLCILSDRTPSFAGAGFHVSAATVEGVETAFGEQFTDNYINIQADGANFSSGGNAGIILEIGCEDNLVENNVISTSFTDIDLSGGGTSSPNGESAMRNIIRNNCFGSNPAGTQRLSPIAIRRGDFIPNVSVAIDSGAHDNIIENNIIAGTRSAGVGSINAFGQGAPLGNIIRNNRIGVGVNGENIGPSGTVTGRHNPDTDTGDYAIGIFATAGDTVTSNIIDNFPLAGIQVRNVSGKPQPLATVNSNQISNSAIGIVASRINGAALTGNTITNCSYAGIVVTENPLDASQFYAQSPPAQIPPGLSTTGIALSQNTFTSTAGPGIALANSVLDVINGSYSPNLATTVQTVGPNLYQPSPRIVSAIRQTDNSIVVTGTAPAAGKLELYNSSRPAKPSAPDTDMTAYGLGTYLQDAQAAAGNFTATIPAEKATGITSLTATITVTTETGAQTSEFARTVDVQGAPPPPDTIPPVVNVAAPLAGLVVESNDNATVSAAWTASDNVGVVSQSIKLTGKRNGTVFTDTIATGLPGTANSFTISIQKNDAVTEAQVIIEALDAAGNKGQGTSGTFTITAPKPPDTEKPVVTNVTFSKKKVKRKVDPTVVISWKSTDNTAVAGHDLVYATDGANFTLNVVSGLPGNAQSFQWKISSSVAKTKIGVVKVVANDAAGNVGEAVSGPLIIK